VQIVATHLSTRNAPSMRMLKTIDEKKSQVQYDKNIFSLQLYSTPLPHLLIIINVVLPITNVQRYTYQYALSLFRRRKVMIITTIMSMYSIRTFCTIDHALTMSTFIL